MEATLVARPAPLAGRLLAAGVARVGPVWFTSVMGTGILAVGLANAPLRTTALTLAARAFFVLALLLFVAFSALWAAHVAREPRSLAATFADTAVAQTWGAPPMACFTIAVGLLVIAQPFAPALALAAAQTLWVGGVALSVFVAFAVPYVMIVHHELVPQRAYASWLLPVVPPIVASVPAALLAQTWPLAARTSILALAYALLGLGIGLAALVIAVFYARLLFHKLPERALVPTLWIVVGPLGQSIAGIIALGAAAQHVLPSVGTALLHAGIAYGVLVWGFGVWWLAFALIATFNAMRAGLAFTLGWWALTFPVGTLTAGSAALYAATRVPLFAGASLALLALLAVNWTIVATHSLRASLRAANEPIG
jgi:tellurite resistance protein TehA-like permease